MIIVVEIAGRTGDRACKEYDAPSINAAVEAARRSFEPTPSFGLQIFGSKETGPFRENRRKSGDLGPAGDGVLISAVPAYRRSFYPALSCYVECRHHTEHRGAVMNILDDLRAEWIAIRKSLGDHIAYLEAGNKIHPIDQDPDEATIEFLVRLKQYRSEVEGWLVHLPSERERWLSHRTAGRSADGVCWAVRKVQVARRHRYTHVHHRFEILSCPFILPTQPSAVRPASAPGLRPEYIAHPGTRRPIDVVLH